VLWFLFLNKKREFIWSLKKPITIWIIYDIIRVGVVTISLAGAGMWIYNYFLKVKIKSIDNRQLYFIKWTTFWILFCIFFIEGGHNIFEIDLKQIWLDYVYPLTTNYEFYDSNLPYVYEQIQVEVTDFTSWFRLYNEYDIIYINYARILKSTMWKILIILLVMHEIFELINYINEYRKIERYSYDLE